jgi:SAM-dependent methyltransferase
MRGWRAMLYTLLWGAGQAFHLGSRAAMYLAAGTLRLHDLRQAIASTWHDFFHSETAILSGLMSWERDFYGRFLKPADHVLVVGCGTGRDLIALLKLGYRVDGVDVSAPSIALARRMLERERLAAELSTGAIETVGLTAHFDAFVFSWFCYGYIPQTASRVAVLGKVKTHLNPEGRILISYVPAERPPRALPIDLARFTARLTRSDWRPELGDVISPGGGGRRALRYEHQFREGELEEEARAAGLTVTFHERGDVGTAVLMLTASDEPGSARTQLR